MPLNFPYYDYLNANVMCSAIADELRDLNENCFSTICIHICLNGRFPPVPSLSSVLASSIAYIYTHTKFIFKVGCDIKRLHQGMVAAKIQSTLGGAKVRLE